jgi:hypothetical protein
VRRRFALVLMLAAGCGGKHPGPAIVAHSSPPDDAAIDAPPHYDVTWGDCHALAEEPFGKDTTVELAECDVDTSPETEEARPRDLMARLILRRDDNAIAEVDLGGYVHWEEGTNYAFGGVLHAPDGTPLALAIYNGGSMGPDTSSSTVYGYAVTGNEWSSELFHLGASQLEVEIDRDQHGATITTCDGTCDSDPDQATHAVQELHWDGKQVTVTPVTTP